MKRIKVSYAVKGLPGCVLTDDVTVPDNYNDSDIIGALHALFAEVGLEETVQRIGLVKDIGNAMHKARDVYEKLCRGDCLTDKEVRYGRSHFRELERNLISCGPVFHLAWMEAARAYQLFDSFYRARKTPG